jgi:hypothetical protein
MEECMRITPGLLIVLAALMPGVGRAQAPGADPQSASPAFSLRRYAGLPPRVACWSPPSDTGSYCGYYVGGGSACRGQPRTPAEGTWGWDYHGCLLPQRLLLQWWHGRRYQGGSGAYKIDGPHLSELARHKRADP